MKNVFLVLFFLGGFSIVGLQAQKCAPCPPCPACPLGCCIVATDKARSASSTAQIMPETMDIMAAYPTAKSLGQADTKCSPAEVAACKTACTTSKTACSAATAPQCQSAASAASQPTFAPQCQPAVSKTVQPSTAASYPQSNQTPKPMKG